MTYLVLHIPVTLHRVLHHNHLIIIIRLVLPDHLVLDYQVQCLVLRDQSNFPKRKSHVGTRVNGVRNHRPMNLKDHSNIRKGKLKYLTDQVMSMAINRQLRFFVIMINNLSLPIGKSRSDQGFPPDPITKISEFLTMTSLNVAKKFADDLTKPKKGLKIGNNDTAINYLLYHPVRTLLHLRRRMTKWRMLKLS
jgi:hypothetical protein